MLAGKQKESCPKEIDDQSTTVGATTLRGFSEPAGSEESATVLAGGSDSSDKETMKSDVTRVSKSRLAASRASGRKQARREAYLQKCQEKYSESGRPFQVQGQAEYHEARRASWLHVVEESDRAKSSEDLVIAPVAGSIASSLDAGQVAQLVLEAAERKPRVNLFSMLFQPARPLIPPSEAEVQDASRRTVVGGVCRVCEKTADEGHLDSKGHHDRMAWVVSCDALMGPTPGPRVYCAGLLVQDLLTEEALKRFWGSKVMEMASMASSIIRARGLVVKKGKKSRVLDGKTQVAGVALAFVQYGGQGKYHARTRMVWAHQLPYKTKPRHNEDPLDPAKMWWPTVAVSFPESVDRELATYMAPSAEAEAEADDDMDIVVWDHEEEVAAPAPPPSLPVQDACPGSSTDVVPTYVPKCIWLSCQEQLQRDTPEAWACPASRL